MTAEIAVLNKSAVALAADSAVSIGRRPNLKVYNTVDKIFELSAHQPVGIMIYGGLDFMGLPMETIIKNYRSQLGTKTFPHIRGYRDDFRNHLKTNIPMEDQDRQLNVGSIIYAALETAHGEIQKLILADVAKKGEFKKSKLNGIAQTFLRKSIDELKQEKFLPGFTSKTLPADYVTLTDEVTDSTFTSFTPTATTKSLSRAYVGYVLAKTPLSRLRSGVVIAGFGTEEWCPSLEWFEMDGFVSGRLKYQDKEGVDIGRHHATGEEEAAVLGFAQDDMVETFLDGISPTIYKYLSGLLEAAAIDSVRSVLAAQHQGDALEAAVDAIRPALKLMHADAVKKADVYIEKFFTAPVRDMVRAMPKQELSNLASALIEITSLKRKVTRAQETVGGEVDVAIISKSEGFVWTQRKHYFKRELNPRFFFRHYQEAAP